MRINVFLLLGFIYFFLNGFALPQGLLYTTLLTPFFYLWMIRRGAKLVIFKFLVATLPFVLIHLWLGVEVYYYFRSYILFFTFYIFCYAFWYMTRFYRHFGFLFSAIVWSNFALTLLALVILFTPFWDIFWDYWRDSPSNQLRYRLAMLTYEPSYYATLLVPLTGFYILRLLAQPLQWRAWLMVMFSILPMFLSFSLGVIASLAVATGIFFLSVLLRRFVDKNILQSFLILSFAITLAAIILLVIYPNNPLYLRIADVFQGEDLSGKARTIYAFDLSYQIIAQKSIWFGIGFGQVKILGEGLIREFYQYPPGVGVIALPNTLAETLAVFGILGLLLRLVAVLVLFFRCSVWQNHYQLLMFSHVFIYQFTGSFYINVAEYVIWILAFSKVFPEFDWRRRTTYANQDRYV